MLRFQRGSRHSSTVHFNDRMYFEHGPPSVATVDNEFHEFHFNGALLFAFDLSFLELISVAIFNRSAETRTTFRRSTKLIKRRWAKLSEISGSIENGRYDFRS